MFGFRLSEEGLFCKGLSQAKVEPMFFCLYNTRSMQMSAAQVWAKMKISVQVMSFKNSYSVAGVDVFLSLKVSADKLQILSI